MPGKLAGLSDEDLMEMYAEGEVRVFEVLYDRHSRPVYNFIMKYLMHRENAEEVLQETFLRVIKKHRKFEKRSKFSTWLYTIARNLCVDALRKEKHRRHKSLDQPEGKNDLNGRSLADRLPGDDRGADAKVMDGEIRRCMEKAVSELPQDQKEVFLLREVSNLQFNEIAMILNCSENTVKSRMRYALERLRAGLSEFMEESGNG